MISINKINIKTYQPRTAIGLGDGTTSFFWDVNGNLAQILNCSNGWSRRLHEWDEENRLRFVLGENNSAYYCYDANGERVYKLRGRNSFNQNINNTVSAEVRIDDVVLYPNPYMVVTSQGYTKHYYAGTERLATAIGQGGLDTMIHPIDSLTRQDIKEYHKPFHGYYSRLDPFRYHHTIGDVIPTETIDGQQINNLQYQCSPLELDRMDVVRSSRNIVLLPMTYYSQNRGIENKIYFYHGDHLGSAHWITDSSSVPIQYIHYAPYGELIVNQKPYTYDERYKFTGKERDFETGYDYFGARYYWSTLGYWLSVDPLAGKYPNISPYAYCNWNPIKFVDPDGGIITLAGSYTRKAFKQLNAATSLKLSYTKSTGVISARGTVKTSSDKVLLRAIKDPNVNINIKTTNKNNVDGLPLVGGAYRGCRVDENGIINTEQVVNPEHTESIDNTRSMSYGTTMLHEVLESYILGAEYQGTGPADTEHMENYGNYLKAHNQAVGLDSRFIEFEPERDGNRTIIPPYPKFDYSGEKPYVRSSYIIDHNEK